MKKRRYPIYDFIAALAFEFDVDWDEEYPDEEPDERLAARVLPEAKREMCGALDAG